ncbi:MAG: type III pantothenate kinase, partial [Chloroflexi bacterium]|nr:type III pantothenate kinase [Chloroflexota bacterium]
MLLVFDIGNTNVTIGVFRDDELLGTWRMASDVHQMPDEYAALLITMLEHRGINKADIKEL